MGGPAQPVLKVPPLPKAVAQLARRLRRVAGRRRSPGPAPGHQAVLDPLQEAGRQLRLAREGRGLGLRQLASETRISTAVLEALEKGWRDRLPEPTYLRTMLPLLERHLGLPSASLQGALPAVPSLFEAVPTRQPRLGRFTPGSIDVFTSWQGTLLYGLLTLLLIHLLNLQQFRLAERGLLSARPLPSPADPQAADSSPNRELQEAFPDLHPLRQAAAGQGLRQLRRESSAPGVDLSLGVLELSTNGPTRVEIQGLAEGQPTTRLVGIEGRLSLPVVPPFRLLLDPPAAGDAVLWQGKALAPEPDRPGSYRYPPAAAPAPSVRP
jgi:hypothetical protein